MIPPTERERGGKPLVPRPVDEMTIPRTRRPSVGAPSVSYDAGSYRTKIAGRRNSYLGRQSISSGSDYEDKLRQASRYQEDVGRPQVPLTAETLRKANNHGPTSSRSTSSSSSHNESDFKQSATTQTTRSSNVNDDDFTIRVKEINISRNGPGGYRGGSDRSSYMDPEDRRIIEERRLEDRRPEDRRSRIEVLQRSPQVQQGADAAFAGVGDIPGTDTTPFPAPHYQQSKREAYTKQHTEKAHGWKHVRSQTAGKQTDSLAEPKPPTLRDEFMEYQADNPIDSASKNDIATAYRRARGKDQRIREQHPSSLERGPSSAQRNSFLEDVKSPTAYHTGDLPSIPPDDSRPGSDELMQTLDHGIIRGFVPEETPYGSDKPAASSPNANAKRPRARFQLGTSDDSDDGDQSLPTNSIAIAPHQAERERRKARGRKSELRVHPSDDQTDRDVPSLPEDREFEYDDDGNRDKPSPTPSPRAPSYYHASGTPPARPATRAHFRHGRSSSGAFDFSPRPPASSPRYTSMGQYAIATGNASSSGVTEFQVPKLDDDMTDYINPFSPSLSITPEQTHESRHPSWERYAQEEAFSEPVVKKPDLIAQIDAAKNSDELDSNGQLLTCNKMWERPQTYPKVQNGDFDLDGLCSELQKKAKSSGTGAVVDETDFHTVMRKYLGSSDERPNPLRRQNHVDFPTGLPHETAPVPRSYTCAQCNRVFDQLHKLNHHIRYHELTPAEAQARSLLLQNDIDPERLNPEQFRAFSEASQQVQVKMIKQSHIRYDVDSNGNIIPIPGGPTDSKFLEQFRAFNEANPQVQDNVLKTYNVNLQKHDQQQQADRPTYTRMSLRHLDIDTLIAFKVDWEYDPEPGYILIKRWVPEWEQDQLWAHTHQIRLVRGSEKDKTEGDQFTLVPNKGDLDVGSTDMPSETTAAPGVLPFASTSPATHPNQPNVSLSTPPSGVRPKTEQELTLQPQQQPEATQVDSCCVLCGYRPKGAPQWFKGIMAKHMKTMHSSKETYKCPFPGCTSQYTNRKDSLRQHQIEKGHFVDGQEPTIRRPSKKKKTANDQDVRPEDPAVSGTSPFRQGSPLAPMPTGSHQDFSPAEPSLEGKIPNNATVIAKSDSQRSNMSTSSIDWDTVQKESILSTDIERSESTQFGKSLKLRAQEALQRQNANAKARRALQPKPIPIFEKEPSEPQRVAAKVKEGKAPITKTSSYQRPKHPKVDGNQGLPGATDPGPLRSPDYDDHSARASQTSGGKELSAKAEEVIRKNMAEAMRREGENEEVLQARVGVLRKAQEEARVEVETAEADAERAAWERIARERTVVTNADRVPPDNAAGKPEKRLERACITCLEQRIRCVRVPAHPRCVRCERFGRVCRMTEVPSADHDVVPTSTTDLDEQTLKQAEGLLGDEEQPMPIPSPYDEIDLVRPPFDIESSKLDPLPIPNLPVPILPVMDLHGSTPIQTVLGLDLRNKMSPIVVDQVVKMGHKAQERLFHSRVPAADITITSHKKVMIIDLPKPVVDPYAINNSLTPIQEEAASDDGSSSTPKAIADESEDVNSVVLQSNPPEEIVFSERLHPKLLDVSEQRFKVLPVGIASATPDTTTEAPDIGSTQTSAHLGYGALSSSSSRQTLPAHMKERRFTCDQPTCRRIGKAFSRRAHLLRHMQLVHGIKEKIEGSTERADEHERVPPPSQMYHMAAGGAVTPVSRQVTPVSRQMSPSSDQDVHSPSTPQDEELQDDMTQDEGSLMSDLNDVLLIKTIGTTYRALFPPYSVGNGQVLVHHLRTRVQTLLALSDEEAEGMRLVYSGRVLEDAELPIREYDVKQHSEIMVSMGESFPVPSINDQLGDPNWSDKDPLKLQPQAYSVPDSSFDYHDNAPTDSGYASLPRQDKVGGADESCGNVQSAQGPSETAQLDLDSLDAGTVYSDEKSESSGSRTQRYISEFADHFLGKIRHQMIGDNAARLSSCLPDMLKAFALKFGQTSSTRGHREVMYFVHKNRKSIAQSIQDRLRAEDNQGPVESRREDPSDMSIGEKLRLWARKEASQDFERETDNLADLEDEVDTKELARYQSLIMDSPAFDWLLGSVQRELRLDDTVVQAMTQIRQQILQGLPAARQISRKRAIPSVQVRFNIQWDPVSFIEEQGYDGDFQDVFGKIITLTGSTTDVQAATCEQYLCQTWPSTGKHMLRILQGMIGRQSTSASASDSRTYIFPDNTRIAASYEDKTLTLEASGTTYSMAEIGEQLGWLVAAIRSSRSETEMSLCCPQIRQFQAGADPSQPFSCEIGVDWMAIPLGKESGNGRCWHGLFNNPAIVWGYPIPRRQPLERGTGLEIPLAMLVALADATTVSEFDNKTFIKGFSAMLIPTNQVDDIILWHLLFNEDGSRISYIDSRALGIQHINPTGLREARHILGWTTKAKNHTGSPDANYDIKWSGLGKPREYHAWEKVVISGGDNGISLGASIVIGKKDKAISAGTQGGYASRLKFIAKQYVVMYDLSDRRAWLVDGLSALLHLVRASLEHDEKDVFNSFCLYKKGQLQEASSTQHGADAAAAILLNQANCSLRLYIENSDAWDEETEQQKAVGHGTETVKEMVSKKKVTYYCLKNRVLEIWSMLEKMIDHLNNVQSEPGVGFRLRGTPRNILEGFDFMDVATNNAPVRPHMVKLNVSESGRGWTGLLRSIQAVTLFGKGFGDLITPETDMSGNPCDNCGYAVNLPVGKDYMGTCVNLVEQILRTRGSSETVPWRLADDIYWHTPGSLFEPCRCSATSKRTPCDRAQVLVPSSHPHLWARRFASPKWLESQGAVMFSHTWKVPLRLGSSNNNNNNKPEPDSLSVPDRDSGLGTSLDSLSARSDLASGSTDGTETQDDMLVDGSTSGSVILPSQADVNCDMTDGTLPPGCASVQMPLPDCDSGFGPGKATPAACRKRKREMVSDLVGSIKKKFAKSPPDVEMEQLSLETREAGLVNDPLTRMQR